jgi:hypothetical protein
MAFDPARMRRGEDLFRPECSLQVMPFFAVAAPRASRDVGETGW